MTAGIGHNDGPPVGGSFIVYHRQWLDHWLVGRHNPDYCCWWLDLMCGANYAPGVVTDNGHRYELDAGQLVGAYRFLARRWSVSVKKVRTFLNKLDRAGLLTVTKKGTQKGTHAGTQSQVLSINYYNEIMDYVETKRHAEGHAEGPAKGTQGAHKGHETNKNNKNNNRNKSKKERGGAVGTALVPATPCQAVAAFEAYNEVALRLGLPQARTLTPQRRKNLIARLNEHGGLDAWHTALANIERSAFLRGGNNRGWTVDLDFMLQASKFTKLVEGTYGNGAHAGVDPRETQTERTLRLAGEARQRLDQRRVEHE